MYPDERLSRLELVSLANAPDIAALHARDILRKWNWPGPLDVAWLVVAELVNSAVARPVPIPRMLNHPTLDAARPLRLTLHWKGPMLNVELWDSDPTPTQIHATHPERHGARGLALVAGYCSRWSYHFPPEGGKVLWCELPATPALPQPESDRALPAGSSAPGRLNGSRQPRALPAAGAPPEPRSPQPPPPAPGYPQPGPGYPQPGPGYPQQPGTRYPEPGGPPYQQPGPGGYGQPGNGYRQADPGYAQAGPGPGYAQAPGHAEPATGYPGR